MAWPHAFRQRNFDLVITPGADARFAVTGDVCARHSKSRHIKYNASAR